MLLAWLPSTPCCIRGSQGIPMVQHAGTSSTHSPLPHASKATPLCPCLRPHGQANVGRGLHSAAGHGDRYRHAPDTHAVGTGQRSKCVPSLHTWLWVLRFCMISVICFNSQSAAPNERCQVLPEQPMVPFLALTTNSNSQVTDALAGTFPQVRQRQPRVAERSRSQPGAPTRASPLPACPRVRHRAGSRAR